MFEDLTLVKLAKEAFLPIVGFIAGAFWRKFREWFAYIKARARYLYSSKLYPEVEEILLLDTAIPNFILDAQSMVSIEETFILSVPQGVGFEQRNEQLTGRRESQQFYIGSDQVFGASTLNKLEEITGLKGLVEKIEAARIAVAQTFLKKKDGLFFNSKKVGLRNFLYDRVGDDERSRLDLRIYHTDYFTHAVMQKVIKQIMAENPQFIKDVCEDSKLINERFYPFTTSIGLNVFLFSDLKRRILLSRRSSHAASGNSGANLVHVTMNEGFSQTDYDYQRKGDGHITVLNCFRRGMREELGIGEYESKLGDVYIYDLFLVKESFQIGLFAWANYQGSATEVMELRAQDKQLESTDLFDVSFSNQGMKELLTDNKMVPYSRVGLENLCRIHGLETTDFKMLGFDYYWCIGIAIYGSLFKRRRDS